MTRILYIQFTNPGGYPPLEHSAAILAEQGAEVTVLGTTAGGTKSMGWPDRPRVTVEIMPKRERGLGHKLDYLRYTLRVMRTIRKTRPDWLYVSDALAAPIALLARSVWGVQVVYHEHDEQYAPQASRLTRAIGRARNRLARVADVVIAPNGERAERIRRASGRKQPVRTVWNCPRRSEIRQNVAPLDGPLRLVYQGSIARERVPRTLVEVLALVPDVDLTVIGYETIGTFGYLAELQEEARQRGVSDRLHILGSIPRSQILATTASCHVGLSFMPTTSSNPNEQTMVGSSNKAFEYLACGLALLVSDGAEWRESFVAAGLARACDPTNPASLAETVRWYAEHRDEVRAMGEAGQARIAKDWNYEAQFAPLAEVMLERVHGGGTHGEVSTPERGRPWQQESA